MMLQTTVASANSALQRARAAVATRVPERSQQATVRALGDRGLRELVGRYVEAWERCDVDAFTALLVSDATFAMPPLTTWYTPGTRSPVGARVLAVGRLALARRVRRAPTPSPRSRSTRWTRTAGAHLPFALNVLTLRDGLVCDVTAFIVRAIGAPEPDAYVRFPEQPMNADRLTATFRRFGLAESVS